MGHLGYIAAAYGVSIVAIGGLATWLLTDMAARRRELDRLHKAGYRRRSDKREIVHETE
ncbi:heme exporter protein CcmD [Notoacmeibacter ruber]|uniref:Heme exporter protein D n=1 Tax=Notoacmeibacter ruber TaxID=2670375 RepID=A0A3L7JKQ4_9HYPH|nr:heme exporter protein CcmD [Notoacmeibacter ruber]